MIALVLIILSGHLLFGAFTMPLYWGYEELNVRALRRCICFKQLKVYENNHLTHVLELLVMVFALKTWIHNLHGVLCGKYTNHQCPKYLFSQQDLNIKKGRWLEFIIIIILVRKAPSKVGFGVGMMYADLPPILERLFPRLGHWAKLPQDLKGRWLELIKDYVSTL